MGIDLDHEFIRLRKENYFDDEDDEYEDEDDELEEEEENALGNFQEA